MSNNPNVGKVFHLAISRRKPRKYLYGFDIKMDEPNPSARVSYPDDVDNAGFSAARMNFGSDFSYGDWPSKPGEKFMPRPCMLTCDCVVEQYLDPDDYSRTVDGSASRIADISFDGNAMMEWPKIWTKRWESDGVYHFRCSDVQIDPDYECWCNYDQRNNQIGHFYTSIFFGSKDSSNRLRSISGQANMVAQSAQKEIDYAMANGDSWYTAVAADHFLIQDLLVMMFKSTHLQAALGNGVCRATEAIAAGTMNTNGLFWGSSDRIHGVKAFGMENLWGNLLCRTAGWIYANGVQKLKLTRGTRDGSTAADYNIDGTGYREIAGSTLLNNGFITKMKTESFGRLPIDTVSSSVSEGGEQYEADLANRGDAGPYYAVVCGRWDGGSYAGPFFVNLKTATNGTGTEFGTTLSCKPLAT